jgi:hypothetical protein
VRLLNGLALGLSLPFTVPYAGRALKWIWSTILTAVWGLASVPEALLALAGVRWEKRLRVQVVVLRDEAGEPVVALERLDEHLALAREIFASKARVRIEVEDISVSARPSATGLLEPGCHTVGSFVEDLGRRGSAYELLSSTEASAGNFRRLVGYGAPVVVLVVRSFRTKHLGCSLGPLTDYVTIAAANAICLAHELGHACGLPHSKRKDNLMSRFCGQREIAGWQVAVIRSSRHVTTF